ncbi:B12-binding domain-containing radical SAM protein [Ideonella azotifigens]|uniref:Radical SAM protein n=1 Tax=Ideonella azotifigens TaxID=513160 RepID=A0ABP3VRC1_9BURK|nr:radical SAM protein [Ideonella azotifigens]MCD2342092.1 B12-binding domain-containing radical SAM protein [Ideonella azotifigens]
MNVSREPAAVPVRFPVSRRGSSVAVGEAGATAGPARRPKPGILLFNPWATRTGRVPNSLLHIAAALGDSCDIELVDGNLEADPWAVIEPLLASGRFGFFGCTVMPGPQLRQAVPVTRQVRANFPRLVTIWGGYFPSNHPQAVLQSGCVDYVVQSAGEGSLPALLAALCEGRSPELIPGLIFLRNGEVVRTGKAPLPDLDLQPALPLDLLARRHPIRRYLPRTFLGRRTHAMHTSMGCPFMCAFCAVVPLYQGRWVARSAELVAQDVLQMRDAHGVDAIEFTDNNFFVSEKRVRAFAERLRGQGVAWWGEGRIDTLDHFSDQTLALMREAGCRMIFFGAESGDDEVLAMVDKGGRQSGAQILRFAARLLSFGITPEYSFVLGFPRPTEAEVWAQIHRDIGFIRQLKQQSPATEVILYIYSPVPTEGTALQQRSQAAGFRFPNTLEDWVSPAWESFDLHRNPLTPWLTPAMVRHIHDFETVMNARYPTRTDFSLGDWGRRMMQAASLPRYWSGIYRRPLELKVLQRLRRYTRPEVEGFYAESN